MLVSYHLELIIDTDSGVASLVIPKKASKEIGKDTIIGIIKRVVNNLFVGSYNDKQVLKCDIFPLMRRCESCKAISIRPENREHKACSCGSDSFVSFVPVSR